MITIEKRVSLDFLGAGYEESYCIYKAIPVKDYADIQAKVEAVQEANDNQAAMEFMVDLLRERFIRGEIAQDGKLVEFEKDYLNDMPGEFFIGTMEALTGQNPKA